MADRISTISIFNNTIRNFGVVQSDIADLTRQISSGREAKDFKDLGNKTRLVLDLESKLLATKGYVSGNQIALIRLNRMNDSLSSLEEIATSLRNNLVNERSAAGDELPLADFARAQLAQVRDALNNSVSGRFLFAGGRTDVEPVSDIVSTSNLLDDNGVPLLPLSEGSGTVSANYYLGDNDDVTIRATDQLTINYGITADSAAFQNLIGALHTAIRGEVQDDDDILVSAVDLVNEALDGIVSFRNQVNSNIQIMNGINELHENFKTYLNQTLGDQVGVDVVEATTQLSLNQTLLQATFQNFSRISNLKLVDFLG